MPEAELVKEPAKQTDIKKLLDEVKVTEPEAKPKTKEDKIKRILDTIKENKTEDKAKLMELLVKLNELVDLMEADKIDNLKGLKEFTSNIELIIGNNSSELAQEIKEEKDKLIKVIEENKYNDNNMIVTDLRRILEKIQHYYQEKKVNVETETEDKDIPYEGFNIKDLDELYEKLYEAITNNDIKKITNYRGKIIRKLKRNKKAIENKYNEMKYLIAIKELIEEKNPTIVEIKDILSKDKKYKNYFAPYLESYPKFKNQFDKFIKKLNLNKIILYKEALNEELQEQSKDLKERYEKEFLDKKGTLASTVTMLPNAVGLSVKKLANTITELQEAKTNRKKIAKATEAIGDTFKVLGTPVIYLGKFLLNNWYSFYMLYKGGGKAIIQKEQEKQREQANPQQNSDPNQNVDAQDNGTGTPEPEAVEEPTSKPRVVTPRHSPLNPRLQVFEEPDNGTGTPQHEVAEEPTSKPRVVTPRHSPLNPRLQVFEEPDNGTGTAHPEAVEETPELTPSEISEVSRDASDRENEEWIRLQEERDAMRASEAAARDADNRPITSQREAVEETTPDVTQAEEPSMTPVEATVPDAESATDSQQQPHRAPIRQHRRSTHSPRYEPTDDTEEQNPSYTYDSDTYYICTIPPLVFFIPKSSIDRALYQTPDGQTIPDEGLVL